MDCWGGFAHPPERIGPGSKQMLGVTAGLL
jgi:hypothetical protein